MLAQQRAYYAGLDEGARMERMVADITLGVAKHESAAVTSEHDSEVWDRLVSEMRGIVERGQMPVFDVDF